MNSVLLGLAEWITPVHSSHKGGSPKVQDNGEVAECGGLQFEATVLHWLLKSSNDKGFTLGGKKVRPRRRLGEM